MSEKEEFLDILMERDGESFAGLHIVIDLYGADRLNDVEYMKSVMKECVDKCGAHLLHLHIHPFEVNGGLTGVAALSESHISVHSWPEKSSAHSIFLCVVMLVLSWV